MRGGISPEGTPLVELLLKRLPLEDSGRRRPVRAICRRTFVVHAQLLAPLDRGSRRHHVAALPF